jgi:hypothetical protein
MQVIARHDVLPSDVMIADIFMRFAQCEVQCDRLVRADVGVL